jgi:hypothetical protein
MANRESASSWREFLTGLRERGLHGVEFVVSDDHAGLKKAIREVFRKRGGSAAMFIFLGTPWITCRARWTTIA